MPQTFLGEEPTLTLGLTEPTNPNAKYLTGKSAIPRTNPCARPLHPTEVVLGRPVPTKQQLRRSLLRLVGRGHDHLRPALGSPNRFGGGPAVARPGTPTATVGIADWR